MTKQGYQIPLDFDDEEDDAIQDQYGNHQSDNSDREQLQDRHLVDNYSEDQEDYADDGDDYVPGINDMADDLPADDLEDEGAEDNEA